MKLHLLVMAGHLGKDSGAIANNGDSLCTSMQEERWINLQQALGFVLAHAANPFRKLVNVTLVVPKGIIATPLIDIDAVEEPLSLDKRVALANEMDADVIEIHNNAAPYVADGCEALCFSKYNRSGNLTESYILASNIVDEISLRLGIRKRGVFSSYDMQKEKYIGRPLHLLSATRNAAVITEAAFLTNRDELNKIDIDLDGYNETIGLCIWRAWAKTLVSTTDIPGASKRSLIEMVS